MARRFLAAMMAAWLAFGAAHAAMPNIAADVPGAPFALELRYARALSGARIAEASAAQMEKTGGGTPAQRAGWLSQMRAIFPDVKEGSSITGVFLPGGAVRFHLDGAELGAIAEPGFAQAFAGIWLSPRTTAPRLRQALLKEAARR